MSTDRVRARFIRDEEARKDRKKLPSWVLDKIADEKMDGGWDRRRENLCDKCWTYRSRNGKCLCD